MHAHTQRGREREKRKEKIGKMSRTRECLQTIIVYVLRKMKEGG
jgi:hypothetical protein